jgi:polar amino acid transport system permease protein
VIVVATSVIVALAVGLLVALGRLSARPIYAVPARVFIELPRNLPFMVLLYLLFFGLPGFGIQLPAYQVGIVALSLYGAAYYAEVFRAAIRSVPKHQWEAARALGLSHARTLRFVIIPQMMGFFIPPATNQAIMLLKESAVLSTITVLDITMAAQVVQGYTYRPLEVYLLIALLYWALTAVMARVGRALELRLQPVVGRR